MGSATIAMGNNSVSMGTNTQAHGLNSHAEGENTYANSHNSHAEGKSTQAHGANSHAEGEGTITIEDCGHVQGRYNSSDSGYAHVVGNGTSSDNPSDAYTLDWDGNAWFSGDVSLKSGHKLSEKVNSSQIAPMVNNVIANTLSEKTTLKIYFDDNTYSEFEVYQNNSKQNIEY